MSNTRFIKRRSVTLVKGRRLVLIAYDKEKETPWVQTLVLLSDFTPSNRLKVDIIQQDTRFCNDERCLLFQ